MLFTLEKVDYLQLVTLNGVGQGLQAPGKLTLLKI